MSLITHAMSLGKLAAGVLTIGGPLCFGIAIRLSDNLAASAVMACVGIAVGFFGLIVFCKLDADEAVEHDRRLRRQEG